MQTGLTGLAGLSLPGLLPTRAEAAETATPLRKTAVILFWLSGGPSQIDTWDPKPDAPSEIRGPYRTIATRMPGIHVCEHLPLQARIMDRLTLLRAVRGSEVVVVFRLGNWGFGGGLAVVGWEGDRWQQTQVPGQLNH